MDTEKVIIIRYAEIHLKGKNRGYFERVFSVNLERALKGIRHELHRTSGRYLVAKFNEDFTDEIRSFRVLPWKSTRRSAGDCWRIIPR